MTNAEHTFARHRLSPTLPVVYYVGVGDLIKIGRTDAGALPTRMSALRAEALLAVEPGDSVTERQRHHQFAHARSHGEWFKPTSDLLDHIDNLPKYDLPPVPRPRLTGRRARKADVRPK